MIRGYRARLLVGIVAVMAIQTGSGIRATAQQPEEIPGLEELDSIPASSGFTTVTRRTVYIDSAGVRSDSAINQRSRYDRQGRITEIVGIDGSGEELYTQTFLYDPSSGRVSRSLKIVSEYNEISSDWWYEHDQLGRISHAADSVTGVAVDYRYGGNDPAAPCIAIAVSGRYRFSGINSYCDPGGRITRQVGYIGEDDTVVARLEYPAPDRRRRIVSATGDERIREWLHIHDSQGRVVAEEYRSGKPGQTALVYRIDNIYRNGLLQRRECRNYGSLDWVEYFEYN